MHYLLGRFIVGAVLCLISFIAYSSQIFIIWPWYGSTWSVDLLMLLIPFNAFVAILFWNYYLCVMVEPGTVPNGWKPDTHIDGYEVKKLTGQPRYCRTCECFKPPRTHHCKDCDRCVLRMDHHCPWINNCVGHHNYSHFLRFLFWVDVSCTYHLCMIVSRTLHAMKSDVWNDPSSTELVFMIMNFVTCVPVLLAVGGFSIYHFFNLLGNSTTIEGWEKNKVATMVRRGQIAEVKFPYDLGKMRNIKVVLGEQPLLWCWPQAMPGNGLRYPLADHADANQIWPPRDPEHVDAPKLDLANKTPFTYGEEGLNPSLQPTNIRRRGPPPQESSLVLNAGAGEDEAVYGPGEEYDGNSDCSRYYNEVQPAPRVRRGSEGYEIIPVSRDEMLRRYIEELGEDPNRYARYEPEPFSASEDEDGDDVPLGVLASRNTMAVESTSSS